MSRIHKRSESFEFDNNKLPILYYVLPSAWLSAVILILSLGLLVSLVSVAWGTVGVNIATIVLFQISAVVALSVFSGNSGIVSFAHSALMGVGAYVSALLTMPSAIKSISLPNLPWLLATAEMPLYYSFILVLIVGIVVGIVTGWPISRLSTGSAAIGTLAFLIIIHVLLIGAKDITRGSQTFYGVPRLAGLVLAFCIAAAFILFARIFRETGLGLKLRASRENEVAASANGVNVRRTRYAGWVLSTAMAMLVGAAYGHFLGAFSPKDFYFDLTFMLIAMLIVGGMFTVTGAILGTVVLAAVIQVLRQAESGLDLGFLNLPGMFGLPQLGMGIALLLIIWRRPLGLAGLREFGSGWPKAVRYPVTSAPAQTRSHLEGILEIKDVSVRFGGVTALDNISFKCPSGKVTGLIGPNGAGKTTLINVICGQLRPTTGSVQINGALITGRAAYNIASLGLARTFQNIRLFDRMTVLENVTVAALSSGVSGTRARDAAFEQLSRIGLLEKAEHVADTLPYGDRRRLEIARALALAPRFLLLDEPAAGMNPAETDELIAVLLKLRAEHALGLLVIEHDMRLIMRVSDQMVVINKGKIIAQGNPEEIRRSPAVIEAYIGKKSTKGELK